MEFGADGGGIFLAVETFAITGVTGQVGGLVARRLARLGHQTPAGARLRLLARTEQGATELAEEVARETARTQVTVAGAEYRDAGAMRRALAGTTTLFLVSGRESADRVTEHLTAVDAAKAAGVRRIVYLSFVGAGPEATFTFARDHWHTEQHIRRTGLRFTILRDNLYLGQLPLFCGDDGVIRAPAGDGRTAAVAHEDIADVAAAVLTTDGYGGQTLNLTGPAALSLDEVAAELTRVAGREIRYQPETLDEAYESRGHYGAPQFEVDGWVTSYVAIARGDLAEVTPDVERVAGHRPRSFAEYLAAHPESYRRLKG